MKLSIVRHGMGLVCAIVLSAGPLASPSQAGLFPWLHGYGHGYGGGYGYGAYYRAPVAYTGGYTAAYGGYGYGHGGCGLSSLFHGCGLFGCARPTYVNYAPSYYSAPACGYSAPACGSGCYGGLSSNSSATGGLVCGDCSTGDCGISSGGGSSSSVPPYSAQPVPDDRSTPQFSPSNVPNKTYREDDSSRPDGGNFQQPRGIPQGGSDGGILPQGGTGGGIMPPAGLGGSGSGIMPPAEPGGFGGSGILPPSGSSQPPPPSDTDIERGNNEGTFFKVPAREPTEPSEAEPTPDEEESSINDPRASEPLNIESTIVYRAVPQRRRAHYRAIFRTPIVAKADVSPGSNSGWTPIQTETKLAANR